jgi:hypothetical protein
MRLALTSVLALAFAAPALAQDPLPCETTGEGFATDSAPGCYTFDAPTGGLLGVAVRADADVYIVASANGAEIGRWDTDWNGDTGAEQAAIPVADATTVTVEVYGYSGKASYTIAGTWVAAGDPGACTGSVPVGATVGTSAPIDLSFEADGPGLLIVLAAADEDIYLTLSCDGNQIGHEDNDFGGELGLEPAAFAIGASGSYTVSLQSYGDACEAVVCAGWLALPQMAGGSSTRPGPASRPSSGGSSGTSSGPVEVMEADISHVCVGQKYYFDLQNNMEIVYEVLAIEDGVITYCQVVNMNGQAVGDPTEMKWGEVASAEWADGGDSPEAPEIELVDEDPIAVDGIEFEIKCSRTDTNGVTSAAWLTYRNGAPTFPGYVRVETVGTGFSSTIELTRIETP